MTIKWFHAIAAMLESLEDFQNVSDHDLVLT
jgi:hypothetical protein